MTKPKSATSPPVLNAAPSATDNSEPASKAPQLKRPPSTWAEIDVGDLVLAENWDPETGWFEAVVLEQVGDDEFKLRFRDYPEEGTLGRRRNQLALLSPA